MGLTIVKNYGKKNTRKQKLETVQTLERKIIMSHGLDAVGSGMFSARKMVPWHNHPSCKVIDTVATIEEGIKLAKMDWTVNKEPTFLRDGRESGAYALVRSDNNIILGAGVGEMYTPLQNKYAFQWFQPFLDSKEVVLDTAGALHGGQKVWVLAKIKRDNEQITPNDEVEKYLMLSNSHDGTTAVRVGFTPIRVVCANTLAMAHTKGNRENNLIRIRHHKDVEINLERVRDIVNAVDTEFKATAEQYRTLAHRNINQNDLRQYVKVVFGMEPKTGKTELSTRSKNVLEKIIGIFENDRNEKVAGANYWTAYNAVSEYLNYDRGHNVDSRLNSLWFGQSSMLNKDAFETALALAT